ncbi:DNA-binding protein RFX6-like [Centruroides vittatus]|uniref:DNA-binding protein RFX6-like n=1 Tax=Centruroides vittatus TaxID=120091 RepID=UPI0035100120
MEDIGSKRQLSQSFKNKKRQNDITLKWLGENYCSYEGVCLPRGIVYEHYLDFCRKEKLQPTCKATFGKIIRIKFPNVTSKRLGARGHSKYHYHGIGIRENSEYYETVYTNRGLTRFSGCKMKNEGGFTRKYTLSTRTGTLLPEFPVASHLKIPETIQPELLQIFLTMYKTHCQCVLDTTIGGNFEEIRSYLLHFWQGLPDHLLPLVKHQFVNDIVAVCDWILYKTLIDVLIPSTLQEMPETLLCEIRNLAHHWKTWLTSSLEKLPEGLSKAKLPVANLFSVSLKRQVSFLHLAQITRPILYDQRHIKAITEDVENVELSTISTLYTSGDCDSEICFNTEFFRQFKDQLRRQATIEGFIEWMDELVEKKVLKLGKQENFRQRAQDFLLKWSFFGVQIMYSMTMNNAENFASFHLLRLLLDEYLLLTMESQFEYEKETELQALLQSYLKNPDNNGNQLFSAPTSCYLVQRHQLSPGVTNHWQKNQEGKKERRQPVATVRPTRIINRLIDDSVTSDTRRYNNRTSQSENHSTWYFKDSHCYANHGQNYGGEISQSLPLQHFHNATTRQISSQSYSMYYQQLPEEMYNSTQIQQDSCMHSAINYFPPDDYGKQITNGDNMAATRMAHDYPLFGTQNYGDYASESKHHLVHGNYYNHQQFVSNADACYRNELSYITPDLPSIGTMFVQ